MEGEKEKVRDTTEGSGQQQAIEPREERETTPVGQDSTKNEYGEIGDPQPGAGSAPPRSMGTRGGEFGQFGDQDDRGQQGQSGTGQADLGSQAGSTLSGHSDQQDLGELGGDVDQPGSASGGMSGRESEPLQGEGFILQTDEQDFARDGQGAIETPETSDATDVEREAESTDAGDSNIEGGAA